MFKRIQHSVLFALKGIAMLSACLSILMSIWYLESLAIHDPVVFAITAFATAIFLILLLVGFDNYIE